MEQRISDEELQFISIMLSGFKGRSYNQSERILHYITERLRAESLVGYGTSGTSYIAVKET